MLAAWVPAQARGGSREPGILILAAPRAQAVLCDGRIEESSQALPLLVLDSTGLPTGAIFWFGLHREMLMVSCSMTFWSGCNTVKSYQVYIIAAGNSSFKQHILL